VTRPDPRTTFFAVRLLKSGFVPLLALLLAPGVAWGAAGSGPPVEVTLVRFSAVRAPNGSNGNWLEATVGLTARPAPGAGAQVVSRVKVAVLLAFELPAPAGGERRLEYYRGEAECVALEPGRSDVRFYLPPELVKRDQLHGDPKYWGVELAVGGRPVPAGRGAYAPTLTAMDARQNFQQRGSKVAAANDGLLLPQYLTPFANEYPRATPSFVRRDGR
jgi:hypothetical protein